MTYKGKRSLGMMITGIALAAGYAVYVMGPAAPAVENIRAWAVVMLIFMGAFIAAQVLVQVLLHAMLAAGIAARRGTAATGAVEAEMNSLTVEDERDTRIGLKANSSAYALASLSLPAALVVLAIGAPVAVGLHVLLGGMLLAVILQCGLRAYYYERGL